MNNWLNKPFPRIRTKRNKFLVSFLFALFIYLFLIIFQPFGMDKIQYYKPVFLAGYFVITFLVMIISFLLGPAIFKNAFDIDKWTIKKEILFILWQISLIAVLNWLYNFTIGKEIIEESNFIKVFLITISIGIFPTIFFVFNIEKILASKHSKIAEKISDEHVKIIEKNKNKQLQIVSDNNSEQIKLNIDDFICIVSEGNYANVFYYKKNEIKKKLIRNSLSKLNEQFIIFDTIKRCHRSYIVNLQNVDKVTGNARNYNLHIEKLDFTIPVSRNFPKSIIKNI